MIVVADASPLRYLILIDQVHVLPDLFGDVLIPPAVVAELTNERTPPQVRAWLSSRPDWLRVQVPRDVLPQLRERIDDGEREAIALAIEVQASALIIDDRAGRREAEALQCRAVGTLGVLEQAADRGFVNLQVAIDRLRQTNFRMDERLVEGMLSRARDR